MITTGNHLRKNHKDVTALHFMIRLLQRRKKVLLYLKRTDYNAYHHVITYFGIPDLKDGMHKTNFSCNYIQ